MRYQNQGVIHLGRLFFITVGTIALGLGIMGLFLPLLPTTPFLLLAAACLARGSTQLYGWLMNSSLGPYISDYREKTGIPLVAKRVSVATLWVTIGSTCIFAVSHLALRALLLLIALGVTMHLCSLPTKVLDRAETDAEASERQGSEVEGLRVARDN